MNERIGAALARIEAQEGVAILYAVESGSRAWGFASTDSDWDVRFIYLRPPEWYLSVQRRRDVLELPLSEGLDISGWDLRKALGLLAKSNPPLLEWLRSPIVYLERLSTAGRLRRLLSAYFSRRSCSYHYMRMADGNYREYLQGERVRVKKYFYVLRPILACRWIEAHATMPPTEFDRLVADQLPDALRRVVADLLKRKRAGEELDAGPRIPELNGFLEAELARFRETLPDLSKSAFPDWTALDEVFRRSLEEAWGYHSGYGPPPGEGLAHHA